MRELALTADELVSSLLMLSETETVCLLDSCGVGYLDSHLLNAGVRPFEISEITNADAASTLAALDESTSDGMASIFTISYDLGRKLLNIGGEPIKKREPDVFLARFETLIVHDYCTGKTKLLGEAAKFSIVAKLLQQNISDLKFEISDLKFEI